MTITKRGHAITRLVAMDDGGSEMQRHRRRQALVTFVLDASVAIAGVLPDENSQRAEAVLSRLTATHGVVPSLWIYEVAFALRGAESRGRLAEADSMLALRSLMKLPLKSAEPDLRHVVETARTFGLSVCDSRYLALSMSRGLPLATFDTRLAAGAVNAGVALLG